jgi:GH35 family endo-1,4-beta-xylanase
LCSGLTIWGISDRHSWYDGIGVFKLHRPNASNLFDEMLAPKPAYQGVVNALSK